jgi:hypothetical protein
MKRYLYFFVLLFFVSSCTSIHKTTKQPFSSVELRYSDFDLSEQQSAEATSVTILGIDFKRLFLRKTGGSPSLVGSIPILGQYLSDPTTSYAMYKLLENNNDADFVFYPQVEKKTTCPILGLCVINKITNVEVKAKLGTFK